MIFPVISCFPANCQGLERKEEKTLIPCNGKKNYEIKICLLDRLSDQQSYGARGLLDFLTYRVTGLGDLKVDVTVASITNTAVEQV